MNKRVGLWFDSEMAVIVSITDNGEEIRIFTTNMDHYVRFSSNAPGDGSTEDVRDRRYWNHVGEYYDKVIGHIHDAKAIQLFGPGEAKYELEKRLGIAGLAEYIVSIDHADKLTDLQIANRVRERFPARSQFDLS
jgi:hypothetical protein